MSLSAGPTRLKEHIARLEGIAEEILAVNSAHGGAGTFSKTTQSAEGF